MCDKKMQFNLGFTIDCQGMLFETVKDHDEAFDTLVVPKMLKKDILHGKHVGPGHIGSTRLYQFIKRQNY